MADRDEVERMAQVLCSVARGKQDANSWRCNDAAALLRALSAQLAEAEARAAAVVEGAAKIIPDESDDEWIKILRPPRIKRMLAVVREAIRALATPAERDALARVRAEVWEEAVRVAENAAKPRGVGVGVTGSAMDAVSAISYYAEQARAAAIRGDDND